MKRTLLIACAAALLLAVAGCSDGTSPSNGQVRVLLTDAPIDLTNVTAVNVPIDEMRLFPKSATDDSGLEMERPGVSTGQGLTLNLLDFQNGETILISALDAPAGDYNKLRMFVSSAEIVLMNLIFHYSSNLTVETQRARKIVIQDSANSASPQPGIYLNSLPL